MKKSVHERVDLLSPVVEAVVLTLTSSILTQIFAAYQKQDLFAFDVAQVAQFVLYAAITTPPNYLFQLYLETEFPARATKPSQHNVRTTDNSMPAGDEKQGPLSVPNTLIKFCLDQSIAATTNTALYICLMGGLKGHHYQRIMSDLRQDFAPLLLASYRFWPVVCLVNFALVPMRYRPYIGSAAGLIWGFWLGLREKHGS